MNALLTPLYQSEPFSQTLKDVTNNNTPVLATGVTDSQKWHLAAGLMEALSRQNPDSPPRAALIVAASELKAKEIYEDLYYFFHDGVHFYPSRDVIFYAADVKSADITRQRFKTLNALREKGGFTIVVVSSEALLDRTVPPDVFEKNIASFSVGEELPPEELARKLTDMGYERSGLVEGPGQFALRGGILDIGATVARVNTGGANGGSAPLNDNQAVRLEFFGDEIDSIRIVDAYSQRSVEKAASATVYPAREFVYDRRRLKAAIENIKREFEETKAEFRRKNKRAEAQALTAAIGEVIERLSEGMTLPNIEAFFPYFYGDKRRPSNLLDFFPLNALLFIDEPNRIAAHMETVRAEFTESVTHRLFSGHWLPSQEQMVLTWEDALDKASIFKQVLLASLPHTPREFKPQALVHYAVKSCMPLRRRPSELKEDLSYWIEKKYAVVILAGQRRHGQTLAEEIAALELPVRYADDLDGEVSQAPPPGVITVTRGTLTAGFEYPDSKLAVVTDKELFAADRKSKRRKSRREKNAAKIAHFSDLRIGDYVVHDNHGIGVFKGIEQLITDGCGKDYLKLEYADGGSLYVHTAQMDMIQKYIGGQEKAKLSKLGGADWARAKSRAKHSVQILAEDLISLYAKRQAATGYPYERDTVWQTEFEAQFPYEETDDQLAAIEDVKRDMQSGKIMDRLICGDVGYGKTEVAIRAAFKAVQDNKQVAYLVPTTILAQQHYMTFKERMKDYPVTVERLSRFQTKKEQTKVVKGLADGGVDIVIGTHRILSKDVSFLELGLIIVDEEQRFGVTHKEKLKALRADVDVLTLTATPIPRTLHLSLSGIRDMSLLDEPPEERRPVQTYVMEYNPEFVRDAINRELSRGGQVYYLHNRVRNIMEEASRVQKLVPEARVAYGHGQMSEHELENVMMDFVDGHIDVLVCTTIVETGLDIPNVNTIIIQDADFMGLSQLYQLRGRVGRSSRLAFAYLMYRKDKILQENAEKRLQTIREFTEFGSGFKIAMRDLEIRGAGNLLGAEQHGHMDAVGYDMYCKLLSEAVSELRGTPVTEDFETNIDIRVNAYIPQEYISDELQKLEMYKKISLIRSQQDYADTQEELEDRFGDPPRAVTNLLEVAMLKAAAHKAGAVSVTQKQRNIVISLRPDAAINVEKMYAAIQQNPTRLLFTMTPSPHLTFKPDPKANDRPNSQNEINDDGFDTVKMTRELLEGMV
ncbi:MAG: transcription-repair coupling factor [Clostridiales bacterium]|jgi:transcription-repair coupling factor (superfamily II helicase)|nr:transcription-repair coupling factor [Clostridiales bacterium]